MIALANFLPALLKVKSRSPSNLTAAITTTSARIISVSINPDSETIQLVPDTSPKYGGNNKFPAPKNIENNANPTTTTSSAFLLFICAPYNL